MTSPAIVLDTLFLAQVEDGSRWEERFDLLVGELRGEYGSYFAWAQNATVDVDILFVFYPPSHHERVVADGALGAFIAANTNRLAHVYVIVIGRNSKAARVGAADVVRLVNDQCIPHGVKAYSLRALRPEDIDDEVRAVLVRLYTRRTGGVVPEVSDQVQLDDPEMLRTGYPSQPAQERSDL